MGEEQKAPLLKRSRGFAQLQGVKDDGRKRGVDQEAHAPSVIALRVERRLDEEKGLNETQASLLLS